MSKVATGARKDRESGFTIIELLIATAVFSMVLVIVTMGFMSLSNAYFKSTVTAATQSTTRDIADTLGKAIQFSGPLPQFGTKDLPSGVKLYQICANNRKFFFVPNVVYLGGEATEENPGLYVQPYSNTCDAEILDKNKGTQLLGENMSIANLDISYFSNLTYTIKLRVMYGQQDMFCSATPSRFAVACDGSPGSNAIFGRMIDSLRCKTDDNYFCAVATSDTTVKKRMTGN